MTVQQLRAPRVIEDVVTAQLAVRRSEESLGTVADAELEDLVRAVSVLEAQVSFLKVRALGESERRHIASTTGATGTDAWAAALTGSMRGVMAGGIWLARLLEERYPSVREAFAAGRISEDQARVIVRIAEQMSATVTESHRLRAETVLVDKAVRGLNPARLRQAARRMLEVVSPRLADAHETAVLRAEEHKAEHDTWLSLHDRGDGTFVGRFQIPELHGHLLRSALETLTAPRRLSRTAAGDLVDDPTVHSDSGGTLPWAERLGAAFVELLEHLPTAGHGPAGATVVVHLEHDRLLSGLGSASLDTGARISAAEARRLACCAGIIPMVLGGRSQPLDLGRESRLFSKAQRVALSQRYDSCAAQGCERPFAWCELHHPHAWALGGRTDLDNALPLCGHHHRRAHDDRYLHQRLPDGSVRFRRRT